MAPTGEKDAWLNVVEPSELDTHMANIEQAKTNAIIIKNLFLKHPLTKNSSILVHGCGTCQMFDYIRPSDIGKAGMTFADISKKMLDACENRLKKIKDLSYRTVVDDIENTNIREHYDAILLTLVLLHVNWKKCLDDLIKLAPSAFYIIEQEQETGAHAVTRERKLPPSIQRYAGSATPELIPRKGLTEFLLKRGYELAYETEKEVPDNKIMVGLIYKKR